MQCAASSDGAARKALFASKTNSRTGDKRIAWSVNSSARWNFHDKPVSFSAFPLSRGVT